MATFRYNPQRKIKLKMLPIHHYTPEKDGYNHISTCGMWGERHDPWIEKASRLTTLEQDVTCKVCQHRLAIDRMKRMIGTRYKPT
jgi:hypothetical protein